MSSRIFFLALVFLSLKGIDAIAEERSAKNFAKATFAGGCFWCMEQPFDALPGVIKVVSGYTGGAREDPTYEEVSSGGTGHLEAIQIEYNPHLISYQKLLGIFWRNIDPTNDKGQFCDEGSQYRSAIFYHDDEQERLAETSKNELGNSKHFSEAIVTSILPASDFYPAEDYLTNTITGKSRLFTRFTDLLADATAAWNNCGVRRIKLSTCPLGQATKFAVKPCPGLKKAYAVRWLTQQESPDIGEADSIGTGPK